MKETYEKWLNGGKPKIFCRCGCDTEIEEEFGWEYCGIPRFIRGHSINWELRKKKIDEWIQAQNKHFCKCGCGNEIIITEHHMKKGIPQYINGHASKHLTKKQKIIIKAKEKVHRQRQSIEKQKAWQKNYMKNYIKTSKGKNAFKRAIHKRRNELGFNPLNEYFEGSHAHHINKDDVIYIPKIFHLPGHALKRPETMNRVNALALFYLKHGKMNKREDFLALSELCDL